MRTRLDSRLDDWSPSGLVSRVCGVARRFLAWRHCDVSLLLVLVVGITAANLVWRTLETRPPHFDMAGHLRVSLEYADYLDGGNLFDFLWSYHYYPPMIYWSASLFYTMSGHEDIAVAVASNALFLTVLAISTYAIGRRLGGRLAGLLASFFVLTTPMLVTQFKEYQTDAPLTAMVALSLYFLIVANGFSNRQASILLGVAAGLGALTKWSFLLTMLLPVLFGVAVAIRSSFLERSYERLVNVVLAGILFYAIAAPWYVRAYDSLTATYHERGPAAGAAEGDPPVHSLASYLWYLWKLLDPQLFLLPVVAFLVGLVFLARRHLISGGYAYLLLQIVGTYGVFTLLLNKDARFTLPMLPSVAIIATAWIPFVRPRVKTFAVAGALAYGAFLFAVVSFGFGPLPERVSLGGTLAQLCRVTGSTRCGDRPVTVIAKRGYIIGPPSGEDWHQEEIFDGIAKSGFRRTLWYQSPDTIWFNHAAMDYYSWKYGVDIVDSPNMAAYIAIRDSQTSTVGPRGFTFLAEHQLPDGTVLMLYRRLAPQPAPDASFHPGRPVPKLSQPMTVLHRDIPAVASSISRSRSAANDRRSWGSSRSR